MMQEIENYNFGDCCLEEHCSTKAKWFDKIVINRMRVCIALCDKHKDLWDEGKKWGLLKLHE